VSLKGLLQRRRRRRHCALEARDFQPMTYQPPRKCILSPEQLAAFQTSETRTRVISYINSLNEAVVGVKLTDECPQSEVVSVPTPRLQRLMIVCAVGCHACDQCTRYGRADSEGYAPGGQRCFEVWESCV
jgi:hypothetical protein